MAVAKAETSRWSWWQRVLPWGTLALGFILFSIAFMFLVAECFKPWTDTEGRSKRPADAPQQTAHPSDEKVQPRPAAFPVSHEAPKSDGSAPYPQAPALSPETEELLQRQFINTNVRQAQQIAPATSPDPLPTPGQVVVDTRQPEPFLPLPPP